MFSWLQSKNLSKVHSFEFCNSFVKWNLFVDFTREPIIETVITPREGFKLVVRSSKGGGQEEHFVDAVEVVSFGSSFFLRSLERPKCFLVPATDYEVLEVREARMVIKHVGTDRSIKIGGGRDANMRAINEPAAEKHEPVPYLQPMAAESADPFSSSGEEQPAPPAEGRTENKRRDRRRPLRRRRGRDDRDDSSKDDEASSSSQEGESESPKRANSNGDAHEPHKPKENSYHAANTAEGTPNPSTMMSTLLPPPPTLISETIARYKDNALFKGAFFTKEEKELEKGDIAVDKHAMFSAETVDSLSSEGTEISSEELAASISTQPSSDPMQMLIAENELDLSQRMHEDHPTDPAIHDDLWNLSDDISKDHHHD